ncbi:MAG: hypothetical protein A4E49_01601 [Methanosaeta sp. PtaU1.Bin112]|nr:MAG: hypothetical protein A4E49_01601 [Methanosaeta sp. PtaU1.Bin112]
MSLKTEDDHRVKKKASREERIAARRRYPRKGFPAFALNDKINKAVFSGKILIHQ